MMRRVIHLRNHIDQNADMIDNAGLCAGIHSVIFYLENDAQGLTFTKLH